jgi:hypothetical protein
MTTLITAPLIIAAGAFFCAISIIWILFPIILLKRLAKLHNELADLNSKTKHPPIVASRPLTKSAKDDLWAKAQAEG